ncbi:MAG TPA: hypothetical protein DCY57_09770 [Bacteroidetes bacterium]|nr:hypothetical protein [Bacteroidota bacterium]
MNSNPLTFVKSGDDGDLCERTLVLLQHFGSGGRSRFLNQIARRAVPPKVPAPTQKDWWRIFNRLQDFGLIAIQDSSTNPRWVWCGDCLFQFDHNRYVCPPTAIRCDWFSDFEDVQFERETLFELGIARSVSFQLNYLSFNCDLDKLCGKKAGRSSPVVRSLKSFVKLLPSAKEILVRTASLSESPIVDSSFESRGTEDTGWKNIDEESPLRNSLLRKLRIDGAGYQYWLYVSSQECYELVPSDWIPLLQWHTFASLWRCIYELSTGTLAVPTHVFYALPVLIRRALISLDMRWPDRAYIDGKRYMIVNGLSLDEAKYLESLYMPALRIDYV